MTLQHRVSSLANAILAKADVAVVRRSEIDSLRRRYAASVSSTRKAGGELPDGAAEYLRLDNPRLQELRRRYAAIQHGAVAHSQWATSFDNDVGLPYVRADNAYVWQVRDRNEEINYLVTAQYLKSRDRLGLFDRLQEDGALGAQVFPFGDGRLLSRDLLDSMSEITFLEESIGISKIAALNVLDIGAGYGRFAHRLVRALPNVSQVFCTDAVAGSTFVCEYYLKFRQIADRARAVPLDELDAAIGDTRVDLATNIHSFSECKRASIQWWLDYVARRNIRYLLIIPNAGLQRTGETLVSSEGDGRAEEFLPDVLDRGYRLLAKRPKYDDPMLQKYGISPTYYFLFERT